MENKWQRDISKQAVAETITECQVQKIGMIDNLCALLNPLGLFMIAAEMFIRFEIPVRRQNVELAFRKVECIAENTAATGITSDCYTALCLCFLEIEHRNNNENN
jgi:hypothetical protein